MRYLCLLISKHEMLWGKMMALSKTNCGTNLMMKDRFRREDDTYRL
ncbi:MAG: hypothetical protein K5874_05940 [Bacteroidaceae bacterium]|nr:hypothetical protein [Bacteroidaceae bacterium]